MLLCAAVAAMAVTHPSVARADACSKEGITHAADQVDVARKALIALRVGDGSETDVSPKAQRAIGIMKWRLGVFVDAYMRCAATDRDAATIEQDLSQLANALNLERQGYRIDELPAGSGHYGFDLDFQVKRWTGQPKTIAIVARISIQCGSDSVLFVFASDGGPWREALRWQSKRYKEVSGAFEAFDYAISPPDDAGKWYVVAKSIAPWCSSTWSLIRYAALRPSGTQGAPRILHAAQDSMWWGNDDFGQLHAGKSDFEIRFHAESIDAGVHNRLWIRHFRINGNSVRRIPPVADSPRDFVDEWIVSPWREASQWSTPEARRALEPWHRRLHKIHSFDFDSVRRCSDRSNHYQIGLMSDDDQDPYYLSVAEPKDYVMIGASAKPSPDCDGEDILRGMEAQ
jgi:hypothetical protein